MLLDHHAEMLARSAISGEVAKQRGYFSVENKRELEAIGFGPSQQRVPSLVIPIRGVVADEDPWFIHRPDEPRVKDGRTRKYEIPAARKMSLDVHPAVRRNLANPAVPLFITEGPKKVDALISAGAEAVIGVIGVWSWRGRNDHDGLAMLADWEDVALKEGRQVYVVYDSDVLLKEPVASAMKRMGAALKRRGAHVAYTRLPSGDGGVKVGADDFLAAGHNLDDIVALSTSIAPSIEATARPSPPSPPTERPRLATEPRILDRLVEFVAAWGLVGEGHIARAIYLVHVSRLLPEPGRAIVKGDSSTGKSYAVDCALEAAAPEFLWARSSTSALALFYSEEDFRHRTLVVYEANKLGDDDDEFARVLRTLISEGKLRHEVTDPKARTTVLLEKDGPVAFISTIAKPTVDKEVETRVLSIWSDGSDDQTKEVVKSVLKAAANPRPQPDASEWHALDRWLASRPADVVVPWAPALAAFELAGPPRLRRDVTNLLALVRAHALLHQATRERDDHDRVLANLDDYELVCDLLGDALAIATEKAVRPGTREIVNAVAALRAKPETKVVSVSAASRQAKRSKSTTHTDVHDAIDRGYLLNQSKSDRSSDLVLGDPMPDKSELLPSREQLEAVFRGGTVDWIVRGRSVTVRSPVERGSSITTGDSGDRSDRSAEFGPEGDAHDGATWRSCKTCLRLHTINGPFCSTDCYQLDLERATQ